MRRWDCSATWIAPLSRSSAKRKKRRTANRYSWENKDQGWTIKIPYRGQVVVDCYQVPSSVMPLSKLRAVPGPVIDWEISSAHCVHMLIDAGVFGFATSSTFSSKVESHDAPLALQLPPKCSSSALSAVTDRLSSCRFASAPHVSGKEIVFYTCSFKQPLVSQDWSPISSQDATFVAEIKGLPTNPLTWAEKTSHH